MIAAVIVTALAALLNRLRGGGWFAVRLPGRALWWVAPAMGLIEIMTPRASLGSALFAALLYLIWAVGPWGRWYDLGRLPVGLVPRAPTMLEKLITTAAGGHDHIALFLRHAVPLSAGLAMHPWTQLPSWHGALMGIGMAAAIVGAYEAAWRWHEAGRARNPIRDAELATGALWGAALIMLI